MPPFRQPINTEDSPDSWEPPDYATPVASQQSKEWKPPDYATPIKSKQEAPKRSLLDRAKDFAGAVTKPFTELAKYAESKIPSETTSLTSSEEPKFQQWAKENKISDVDHPDSHYDYRGYWRDTGGIPHEQGTHFPDTFKQHGHPTFSVESKYSKSGDDGGRWEGEKFVPSGADNKPYIFDKNLKSGQSMKDFIGSIASSRPDTIEQPKGSFDLESPSVFDPKSADIMRALHGAAHPQTKEDFLSLLLPSEIGEGATALSRSSNLERSIEKVPSIRQGREIPYRTQGELPASETPELPVAEIRKPFVNPFEKKSEVSPTRSPNLSDEFSSQVKKAAKAPAMSAEDVSYNLAREKFNMGKDLPDSTAKFAYEGPEGKMYTVEGEPTAENPSGRSTISESELTKRGIKVPEITDEDKVASGKARDTAITKQKEWNPPDYAKPVEESRGSNKLAEYQDYRKTEFAAGRKPIHYDQWANRAEQAKTTKIPEVVNEGLEQGKELGRSLARIRGPEKSFDDLLADYGGSGHPESPDYVSKVLRKAGTGEPGLSVEKAEEIPGGADLGSRHVVYRDKSGNPIAVAKLVSDSNGKQFVQDLAADKSKGLLTGRAMKAIGDKLNELGATESSGTLSKDAENFISRMKESVAVKPSETPSLATKATNTLQSFEDAALERIKKRGTFSGGRLMSGLPADDLADFAVIGATKIAKGVIKFADWSVEMIKDFGETIKPHLKAIFSAAQDKHTEFVNGASKKLLNSVLEAKGGSVKQQIINKAERAKRFAASAGVKEEGVLGAAKSLSAMRGEFEKANPGEALDLSEDESNMLFTTIKRSSKIDEPEKVRARAALFSLLNGDRVPQPNELKTLDKVFGKQFGEVSGPGASTGYDIGGKGEFEKAGDIIRKKKPDDFLTKLANLSSKTTRAVLGFHIPGTAISFHGFNEAIRNTMFGPDFNPIKAAGRFAHSVDYLVRPGQAQKFLDANMSELGDAIREGGLKAATGDIGFNSLFKGSNPITKSFNYLTSPEPLFGRVIPALKLEGYQGLLEQYEKSGMPHSQAAKAAGEATNNIFGGLNLKDLKRSPTTQKLFRASALAPDWLESNVRLGKGMFNAIKDPTNPKSKVYLSGMANFLGSYIALNTINAINNNGKFSFQNDVGHEFDVAIGKDALGRTRYFSPYGTAMDMFRIPLEIAHAAVEGNTGKAFSDMRSRASEPLQFMTDLMTNTDYAGRTLYDKTKYGKPIPPLTQGANIAADAAGHFLPIGAESGVNLAQGKISTEQFASQVLQAPMKYKFPDRSPNSLRLRKLR